MPIHKIIVQPLGVNDTEALLDIQRNGPIVESGEIIATLETTKAIIDVIAEQTGFIRWLAEQGSTVDAGQIIGIIGTTQAELEGYEYPRQRNITNKAAKLALELGVNIDEIDTDGVITTEHVLAVADASEPLDCQLLIHGAGNGGVEISLVTGARTVFVDDFLRVSANGLSVYTFEEAISMFSGKEKPPVFVAIARGDIRERVTDMYKKEGFPIATMYYGEPYGDSTISEGCHVKIGAVIGNNVLIERGAIVDYGCVVSHDTTIGEYAHIAPGAVLGSSVKIGKYTVIGINACVATGVTIADNCIVTPGTAIVAPVETPGVVLSGNPGIVIGEKK